MIITLRDRTEIYLNKERGEILKQALIDGTAPDYISIDSTLVRKDFIVKVQDGGRSPAIKDESHLLPEPPRKPADPKKIAEMKDLLHKRDFAGLKNFNKSDKNNI